MKHLLPTTCAALLTLTTISAPAFAKSWVEQTAPENRVATKVTKDDTIIMRTDQAFKEVRIANAEIADVVVLTDRSFHVMGKTSGKTNVMLYNEHNQLLDIIDVTVGYDLAALKKSLYETLPGERVEIRPMAGGIYMSGKVSSGDVAERAYKIAQAYAPDQVTNALTVHDSHQVMLEVRFVEASRDAIKELGIGLLTQRGGGLIPPDAGDFTLGTGVGLISGNAPAIAGNLLGGIGDVSLDTSIRALEEKGIIRTLAEPNLVAMSGETASFLAGGEFPIPVSADDGQIAIQFRQFGVGLSFTPTVLDDGVINLKVAPEVSQIDNTNSVRIGGVEVPSLRVRRADTTVELRNSQSFAIAGLLQNTTSDSKVQVPWLGEIPVIGSLFRSSRYQNNETELVIIVTPRMVQPASDISQISTPLDNVTRPGEIDLFLNGQVEGKPVVRLGRPAKTSAAGGLSAQYGHSLQ